jgi:hypothetical protein
LDTLPTLVLGYSAYQIGADLKESPWCQQGFQLACTNPDVREELGTSLELGWLATGGQMIVRSGGKESGQAEISISINGSHGKGRLRLKATLRDGEWQLEVATVALGGDGQTIDLLHEGTIGKAPNTSFQRTQTARLFGPLNSDR